MSMREERKAHLDELERLANHILNVTGRLRRLELPPTPPLAPRKEDAGKPFPP